MSPHWFSKYLMAKDIFVSLEVSDVEKSKTSTAFLLFSYADIALRRPFPASNILGHHGFWLISPNTVLLAYRPRSSERMFAHPIREGPKEVVFQ